MDKLLKELKGHSGSTIELRENDTRRYVRKIGNVERNHERLDALQGIVPVPKLYAYDGDTLDMEYIHGYDMKTWLTNNTPFRLNAFLVNHLSYFARYSKSKDYTETYDKWLSKLDYFDFPFDKQQLIEKLPKVLPQSTYHGDMTLENIIHSDNKFYFIDPVTLPFDSYVFDIAKLRQDLDCKWFLRRDNIRLETKLIDMRETILTEFPEANNDYILILMLLRVYCHCKQNTLEYEFILREVHRLWKY